VMEAGEAVAQLAGHQQGIAVPDDRQRVGDGAHPAGWFAFWTHRAIPRTMSCRSNSLRPAEGDAMTISDPTAPDTIVLIHGFWVTPRSWEEWIAYYQAKGYRVLAPAYPGFEVEVEALRADPTPIEQLTVPPVVAPPSEGTGAPERPPILMGHSAGGVFTQLLLDRGYGAVGVVIDSAPTQGVPGVPLSHLKSTFPVLKQVGRKKAAG